MKLILIVLLAVLFALAYTRAVSASAAICQSTGDPHYVTFDGLKKDLYGWQGDFLMAGTQDEELIVLSRVKYGKHWSNRGINVAVAITIAGNVYEHFGNFYKINGKKNAPLQLGNGAQIVSNGNRVVLSTEGASVEFHYYVIDNKGDNKWPEYQFNIYVRLEDKYKNKVKGLCGNFNGNQNDDAAAFNNPKTFLVDPSHNDNFFDVIFVAPDDDHHINKVEWKSKAQEQKAADHCHNKLGLTGDDFNDCMFDILVSGGDLAGAIGYEDVQDDLAKLEEIGHYQNEGTYFAVYQLLKALKANLEEEKDKLGGNVKAAKDAVVAEQAKLGPLTQKVIEAKAAEEQQIKDIEKAKIVVEVEQSHLDKQKSLIEQELEIIKQLMGYVGELHVNKKK